MLARPLRLTPVEVVLEKFDAEPDGVFRSCLVMLALNELKLLLSGIQLEQLLAMLVMHELVLLRGEE